MCPRPTLRDTIRAPAPPAAARPSIRAVTAHTSASSRSGERPDDEPVQAEVAHLVFQRGKRADVLHPALLVERRHRLGAQPLAARGPHRHHRHRAVGLADHRAHHVAALVHFDDQRIGLESFATARSPWRPSRRATSPRHVSSRSRRSCRPPHVRAATSPQASARLPAEAGGSTATTMRLSGGAASTRQVSIERTRPQRVGPVLDDLAVELLAAEPRAGIALQHMLAETPATDAARSPACPRASARSPDRRSAA